MGLVALQSMRHRSIRRIGLPVPTSSSLFPAARWSSFGAGPRSLASTGCSSLELYLLFRDMLPSTRSLPEGQEHLPGFLPPSRHQPVESTRWRASQVSPRFRPQRFARSRRLAPPRTLQACFILLPRPGFALQGFSPLPSRLVSSTSPCPLVVCRKSPPDELPHRCQLLPPRLQGFDPGSDPLRPTGGLDLPITRSPPSLSTPAGFSPATLETPSRPLRS